MRNCQTGKEAIHAKSVPLSRQKFLIDPVCAAVPSDQITAAFFMTPVPTFQPALTHKPHPFVPGWALKSAGGLGKVKRHEGAPNPEFSLTNCSNCGKAIVLPWVIGGGLM